MVSQDTSQFRSPRAVAVNKDDLSIAGAMPENSQLVMKIGGSAEDTPTQGQLKEPEYIQGFKLFSVLAALTLVTFLMLLDGTIIVAAAPRITDDFQSLNDLGWYGAAYQLGR